MTEEEKKAAEAAAAQAAIDEKARIDAEQAALEAEKDEKIKKLEEERDNYKAVALKRLGKLPNDAGFLSGDEEELSVADQVKLALLDREIESQKAQEKEEMKRLARENAELKLALKNRPGGSIGGDGGDTAVVKDNVFSNEQIDALTKKAMRLKVDPQKFIENAKKNLLAHS